MKNNLKNKLAKKLKLLGINYNYNVNYLINLHFISTIIVFLALLIILPYNLFSAPIISIIYYYSIEYLFVDYRIKKRIKKLDREALYFFDVLTLALESGKNLIDSLEITVNNLDSEITSEFKKTLSEVKVGKDLVDSLDDMRKRIPSDTINSVILSIKDASILGSSIIESINNQTEFLREKELLELKSDIAKLPIKLSVISVIFFVPIILLLVLTPVIINLIIG